MFYVPRVEKIPGLGPLIEKLMDSISGRRLSLSPPPFRCASDRLRVRAVFVFTTLEVLALGRSHLL